MKFLLNLEGTISVEIPDEKAAELLEVRNGFVFPKEIGLKDLAIDLEDLLRDQLGDSRQLDLEDWSTVCRACGCNNERACAGGCYWVEPDLCSRCAAIIAIAQDPTATWREEKAPPSPV